MIENQTLFDPEEIGTSEKTRKPPETAAEKRLREVREMEDRDFLNLRNKLNRGQPLTASEARRLEQYREKYESETGVNWPDHMVRTMREVGAYFSRTKRTVINWGKKGMPGTDGRYDLKAIESWAVAQGLLEPSNHQDGLGDPGAGARADAIQRHKLAEAELKELKLAVMKGEYVKRADVEQGNAAKVAAVRGRFLSVPRILAPQLAGLEAREIEARLYETLEGICRDFAQGLKQAKSGLN